MNTEQSKNKHTTQAHATQLTGGETLRSYLRNYLIILGLLFTAIFGIGISTTYQWGLHDTSEFYLIHDAETVEYILNQGESLPENDSFRQNYLGLENLPEIYHDKVKINQQTPLITYFKREQQFDYVIAYPLATDRVELQNKMLFVVHSFDNDESADIPGLTISQLVLISSLVAIVFAFLTASLIYKTVTRAVKSLLTLSQLTEDNQVQNPTLAPCHKELRFSELQDIGDKLQDSIANIQAFTEREKSFIRSLSHELRTPMAIVSAAIDILDKKSLPDDIQPKLTKIRHANQKMIALSDTLLRLWQNENQSVSSQPIALHQLVTEAIENNQYLKVNGEVEIVNRISPEQIATVNRQAFDVIINNLVKNAMQYTTQGKIEIDARDNYFEISNNYLPNNSECDHTTSNNKSGQNKKDRSDYGFGLGLYIVEKIAGQQSWKFEHQQLKDKFTARLSF
ncbi:sensor histidine kinase [Aliikangiella coralliicola]|uniref:histidine kinase n=1 Tax=Aliikangiella coralliicola TaxID=2592383 RepID=A0A545UCF7_9GAMM|nr:HAMP domain-containing sensor histidine kinase [Aliikangiella coralliicola]TQV87149.1 HAMP domain-containing histidine kinase [Aliikangiella coralliicola]